MMMMMRRMNKFENERIEMRGESEILKVTMVKWNEINKKTKIK